MSQTAGRSRGSARLQRISTSSSTSSVSTSSTTPTHQLTGRSHSSQSPASTNRKVPLSPTTISATAFKSAFNSVPPIVNIVVSPHTNLKSFQSEYSSTSSSSSSSAVINNVNGVNNNNKSTINNNNNINVNSNQYNNLVNAKKSGANVSSKTSGSSSSSSTLASKSKTTKMSAAVDVRSMSHSPSPMIESNNNIIDRKTGLPYHHKNVVGMKGTAGNAHVNGTSSAHVQVYKESSISLKPTNGLQDQVPQQSIPPQMYSVSLAFKTPKLHYSNQLYIYPYYVVTFCETAQSKLETDVTPHLEKQIKYCNVFYFDLNSQPKQPQPPPEEEEEEEEEEEWTEFYEEVHHTTVITETKTESAAAFHMQQHAASQQTSAEDGQVIYTDNPALNGPDINGGGGGGGGAAITDGSASSSGGGGSGGGGGAAVGYKGPSLADVISLDDSPPSGQKSKTKRHSKGGGGGGRVK